MRIKLIKKTNEAGGSAHTFDFTEVEEDAKRFDFINLESRLSTFKDWVEYLYALVPFTMPKIHDAASGSSGFSYRISNEDRSSMVQFSLHAGTNPERYPKFEGYIYAISPKETGKDKRFDINSIDDLTDALQKEIVDICKGRV